jgi:hypothetical protein
MAREGEMYIGVFSAMLEGVPPENARIQPGEEVRLVRSTQQPQQVSALLQQGVCEHIY